MKTYISFILLMSLFSVSTFARVYECEFKDDKGRQGYLEVNLRRSSASVVLSSEEYSHKQRRCKIVKNNIGTTINCDKKSKDLMILLQRDREPVTGGIMSDYLDLFADISC